MRDGPLGAGCHVCESRLPGEWKRMKRGDRTEGDHHSPLRLSHVVKGDTAGYESRACKSGGGGWSHRSSNRVPSPSDSSSEDDSSGSDEDDEVSSSRKGKGRGKKVRMSHLKKVVMGRRPLPPSMWICAREDCLEVAEDIGYVIEVLYPMEHVTWTEETELGPERLARTHDFKRKKRKARGSCEDSTPHSSSTSLEDEGCGQGSYGAGSGPDLLDVDQREGGGVMETVVKETGSAAESERGSHADDVQDEKGAEGLSEQEAKERDEDGAKEPTEEGENEADKKGVKAPDEQQAMGLDIQGAKGPVDQVSIGPDEERATGPDEISAAGPDEQVGAESAEEAATGADEQAVAEPDEQGVTGPDEQAVAGPAEQGVTEEAEQRATTSDKQQSMGLSEQAATGAVKDRIVKQEAEMREACNVVLGKKDSSQSAAVTKAANGDDRRYSSGGETVSGEHSTDSHRDGSSFKVPIIVIDDDEESEERYFAEGATTEQGEDRSKIGDCNVEEGGSENAIGGESVGCGKPSDGSKNGVCAGAGCNPQVTADKVHGTDGSLCSMTGTSGETAGLERHPEGGHSVNGDAGTERAGPAGVGGAARPPQLREVVDLAFSDDDDKEKVNSSPRPPVGGDRALEGVHRTRAREGGEEKSARSQGTGSPRFVSPILKKPSGEGGVATASTGPASLTDFWDAGSGGDSRAGENNSGTLVEGNNPISRARTSESGDASAAKVKGEGIKEDSESEEEIRRRPNKVGPALNGNRGSKANGVCSGRGSGGRRRTFVARKGKRKAQRLRKILSDDDLGSDIRGSSSSSSGGDDDLADSDYDIGVLGSEKDDSTDTGDSVEEDDDDNEVVFQGVQQGRRREGPLDERQEREVSVVCVSVYKHVCGYRPVRFFKGNHSFLDLI